MKPPDPVVHARCGGCRRLITDKGPRAKSCKPCDKRRKNDKERARRGVVADRIRHRDRAAVRYAQDGTLEVRASSLGQCRRKLYYTATGEPITDAPSDAALLRMRIGTVLEPVVVDNVNTSDAMPYDLVPWTGGSLELNVWAADDPQRRTRFRVVGTPDATAYESMTGQALVADIKTRGPAPYKQWAEQGAEISHPEAVVQLAAYQAMIEGQGTGDVNAPVLLICLDTGAREWDWERIPGDRARAALLAETERLMPLVDVLSKWRYVEGGPLGNNDPDALETVRAELAPARDFHAWTPQCKSCPFAQACRPQQAEVDAAGKEDEALMAAATLEPAKLTVHPEEAHEAVRVYVETRASEKDFKGGKSSAGVALRTYLEEHGLTGAVLGGHRVSLSTSKTYGVDRKLLAELVTPEIRRRVIREGETTKLNVTALAEQS